jgi:adenylate cyclase
VDLLACGVANGLALQQAAQTRARNKGFFTQELAEPLENDRRLLEGRVRKVTALFCDVRGFSRFSKNLGPAATMRWMNDVMNALSACVRAEKGVLVDYIGDELFAMWGAPEEQPDQEARAVRAALAMLAALGPVNDRWRGTLGSETRVGIGLSTGPAQVGNTGSDFKFKYGPLGDTVNVASRTQGLTKYLRRPLLVTEATRAGLGDVIARRVVRARMVHIDPEDLYEVEAAGDEQRQAFFAESQAALDLLEAHEFTPAARKASHLLAEHIDDGPLQLTLSRALGAMAEPETFDLVWDPPGK